MHPSREQLAGYAFGTIAEDSAKTVADHVADCSECEHRVIELEGQPDDMVAALEEGPLEGPFEGEVGCQRLIDQVAALGRPPVGGHGPSVEAADEPADFPVVPGCEFLSLLGQGGMGRVYKVRYTESGMLVALKTLPLQKHRGAVARFDHEMATVGKLLHPNIVAAHDAGEHEGVRFLVMEYVHGVTLSRLVRQQGPLRPADACELICQTAIGLQYVHEQGWVHRDIKPANLMLTHVREAEVGMRNEDTPGSSAFPIPHSALVKILDLGLARWHDVRREALTSSGRLMGTIDYMAPEQSDDSHHVDIRADIYSLGATLYKLLCGSAPYEDRRHDTLLKKIRGLAVEPVPAITDRCPDIPAELGNIVHRMLAKEPHQRFNTPREVAHALVPFAAGSDLPALIAAFPEIATEDGIGETAGASAFRTADVAARLAGTTSARHKSSRSVWIATALLATVVLLVAGWTTYLATDRGRIVVRCYDPRIEVVLQRNGKTVEQFRVGGRPDGASYRTGEYEIRIKGGKPNRVSIRNGRFTLARGDKVLVEISEDASPPPGSIATHGAVAEPSRTRIGKEHPAVAAARPNAGGRIALADLDGDGDLDAFVANPGQPGRVWRNDGNGRFQDSGQELGGSTGWAVCLGDLDGDGDADAFVFHERQPNKVWINDGLGRFTDSGQALGTRESSLAGSLGDVDNDGDLDVFEANNSREPDRVLLNDGHGRFTDSSQRLGHSDSRGVALVDLDGDGDLDAFVANRRQPVIVWINDGRGRFTDSGPTVGNTDAVALTMADLDGDGDLDAFLGNHYTPPPHSTINGPNTVLLNDGHGNFTDSGQALGQTRTHAVSLADLDGDGDPDAFVANSNGPNRLWLNDGRGLFSDSGQQLGTPPSDGVGLGDLNGDGHPDAFATASGQPPRIWLNDGRGVFTMSSATE